MPRRPFQPRLIHMLNQALAALAFVHFYSTAVGVNPVFFFFLFLLRNALLINSKLNNISSTATVWILAILSD